MATLPDSNIRKEAIILVPHPTTPTTPHHIHTYEVHTNTVVLPLVACYGSYGTAGTSTTLHSSKQFVCYPVIKKLKKPQNLYTYT